MADEKLNTGPAVNVIIGGILAALAGRMKEIEGGEEDEASKY